MNIHLENITLQSTSGPNHFASKLIKYMQKSGVTFNGKEDPNAILCFIESSRRTFNNTPFIQRLDNIYFNVDQNYNLQNANIKRIYDNANGIIFQSNYSKNLITRWFGTHSKSAVIHNGADIEYIESITPAEHTKLDKYEKIWCCASSWRPHKRLNENIRYFLEHSGEKDCLVVAGSGYDKIYKHERIFYVGNLNIEQLISLYKRANSFIHLAYLDCCPNVVVDARASGCEIICASSGGSNEVAGIAATVIQEKEWDYKPLKLYEPPKLDFNKKVKSNYEIDYNMVSVAKKYKLFIEGLISEKNKTV